MTTELSKEQIAELFAFVEKKGVRYIDVQYELVDHLASAIESELEKDNQMGFKHALQKVYGQFPISGFDTFLREKEQAMFSYWRRKKWNILAQYFSLPKLILTFLIVIFYVTLTNIHAQWSIAFCVLSSTIVFIYSIAILYIRPYKFTKKYLVVEKYFQVIGGGAIGSSPIILASYIVNLVPNGPLTYSDSYFFLVMIFCVLSTILVHASVFEFPNIIAQEINNKYAHLQIELT